jgi:aminoglycoside phosphotransferase (APT) family kinase protein
MSARSHRPRFAADAPGGGAAARPHDIDLARLNRYLSHAAPSVGAVESLEQFDGGQSNPTFLLRTTSGQFVLRRKPTGALLPSAHAVDREFRVISALRNTDVPVPKTHCYCGDDSIIGTAFYIMEYVDGVIFTQSHLPNLTTAQRSRVYDELNRVIAALHSIDPEAVGLADFGKAGNFVARQIDRWTRQYRASETESIEAMEQLIDWLPRHVPQDEAPRIIHGDFRLGNVIFDRDDLSVLAVLDWELATLGNPLADFAYTCMAWRMPHELRKTAGADLEALGIPTEAQFVAQYCARTGRQSIPDFDFYVAFNMFRFAAILQGVAARALQGNASSTTALETGRMARPVAEAGWTQASSGYAS